MPEIIDPVFAKTSQNARFLLSENERFGLVFVKTGSINSGTGFISYGRHVVQYRTVQYNVQYSTMSVISVSGFIDLSFDSVKCHAERK